MCISFTESEEKEGCKPKQECYLNSTNASENKTRRHSTSVNLSLHILCKTYFKICVCYQ